MILKVVVPGLQFRLLQRESSFWFSRQGEVHYICLLYTSKQVEIVLGDLTEEEKKELSGVVLSPGVPTDTEFVNDLRNRGLLISGEIELAFEQEKGAVLAITGTNGKTTTTTLLGAVSYTHL